MSKTNEIDQLDIILIRNINAEILKEKISECFEELAENPIDCITIHLGTMNLILGDILRLTDMTIEDFQHKNK